jgi:hypothetical protein
VPVLLDLFAGRLGWSKAFLARGWKVFAVDLILPPEIPAGVTFLQMDVLAMRNVMEWHVDFICASSPCEQFSVHGMKHFHPNPPYPELGIKLFNHTRALCEASGVPYVMENVRAAQKFVGNASHHCGPFYLWGTGIPPLMPQGIIKGMTRRAQGFKEYKGQPGWGKRIEGATKRNDKEAAALKATIPPELANCVADYAERIPPCSTRLLS